MIKIGQFILQRDARWGKFISRKQNIFHLSLIRISWTKKSLLVSYRSNFPVNMLAFQLRYDFFNFHYDGLTNFN